MDSLGTDWAVPVAPPGPALERYEHIQFLSDLEQSASSRPRPVESRGVSGPWCPAARWDDPLEPEARGFVAWVLNSAGLDPDCYRGAPMGRRLQACLRSLRAPSVADARERLWREPERMSSAVGALLIGVTEFFRDASVFSYVDREVLPRLGSNRAGTSVWSAGCADGAELYSVAMLLADRQMLEGSRLAGTDCRALAVREAEQGRFDLARLDRLDDRLRRRYFTPEPGGGRVCDRLRGAVRWQQGNVLDGPPGGEGNWDLVLCRNVAIYLEPAAAARLWCVLVASIRVGGILVVGKAERPRAPVPLARLAPCVFEKQR